MGTFKISIASENVTEYFSHFQVDQQVASHHSFTVYLPMNDMAQHFKGSLADYSKKVIGSPLKVDGFFEGVITSVGISRANQGASTLVVRGSSPTIITDDGINVRSFTEQTLNQIVDTVLGQYSSKFSGGMEIKPEYKTKLKYTVQYRESNFEFVNRLAARFGEWFFYDGQKLTFGKPSKGKEIRLQFGTDLPHFDLSLKTLPLDFKLVGYDYKSHKVLNKTPQDPGLQHDFAKIAFDKSKKEIFTNKPQTPIHMSMSESDLEQIADLRQNMHLDELVEVTGSTENQELRLGSIIEIVDSRSGLQFGGNDNYGKYIITEISHQYHTHGEKYSNQFRAIPSDSKIPPISVSPNPPVCEMQEAKVIENNDPDGLGRVKVQFIWQEESNEKTNWIRVASHSGGGDKGLYVLPEKDDQVLVAFEHNHPERPYVLTGMYHGKAKPEHHDSNNYKKALKTKGGHQILMNDEKGKESMALSSPKDLSAAATSGDMSFTAKGKITIKSDSGDITIDTPATIKIHASKIEINADASISLAAPKIEIKADAELNASGAKVNVDGQAATTVKGGGMLNVESQGVTSISGSMLKLN